MKAFLRTLIEEMEAASEEAEHNRARLKAVTVML